MFGIRLDLVMIFCLPFKVLVLVQLLDVGVDCQLATIFWWINFVKFLKLQSKLLFYSILKFPTNMDNSKLCTMLDS